MRAVVSDGVKSAKKAKDKLHKVGQRASETRERTLHRQKQNNAHEIVIDFHKYNHSMRESRDSDRFLVNTQVQSHALLGRGFGTSVQYAALHAAFSNIVNTMIVYSVN